MAYAAEEMELIDINEESAEVREGDIVYRAPKVYLERKNPLEIYDDLHFKRRYRMRKVTAHFLIRLVERQIGNFVNKRGSPITPDLQVLATIRYLAKGAYGQDTADQHGISQPALSKIVKRVVEAIASHREEFIIFPVNNEDLNAIKTDFYQIAGCPGIVGVIDGTHVKIKCPGGENPVSFINRKGYYSLNVQVVSDAKCRIRDIVARWRGSSHDARIWNECTLKRRFETGEVQGILLGDNGCPSSRFLLTPFINPMLKSEIRYNRVHCATRNVVERLFGIWKNKFRCFFNGLNLKLESTKAAIVALAVIHNIIINDSLQQNGSSDENSDAEAIDDNMEMPVEENVQGNVFRTQYSQRFFNH